MPPRRSADLAAENPRERLRSHANHVPGSQNAGIAQFARRSFPSWRRLLPRRTGSEAVPV